MKLYGYWRSSAAYRVRIALALKAIPYEQQTVHLARAGGEQMLPDYVALNPTKLVPTLVDGEVVLNQSMAIIEYLDEKYPDFPLLPRELVARAKVRALAQDIACDIHPLNNLRILQYLKGPLALSDQAKEQWYAHWIETGFNALETRLASTAGKCCFGDEPSLVDLCLIPQLYNAHRFNVPLSNFPLIRKIEDHCLALQAFKEALPENQPDAE